MIIAEQEALLKWEREANAARANQEQTIPVLRVLRDMQAEGRLGPDVWASASPIFPALTIFKAGLEDIQAVAALGVAGDDGGMVIEGIRISFYEPAFAKRGGR